jgi:outer membrane protein assembly factor BamB
LGLVLFACAGGEDNPPADGDSGGDALGGETGPFDARHDADSRTFDVDDETDGLVDLGLPDSGNEDVDPSTLALDLFVTSERPEGDGIHSGLARVTATISGGAGPGSLLGVEFYIDGFRIDTDLIPPFDLLFNSAQYEDGEHVIEAFTADREGGTASASSTVTLDNTPPVFLSSFPADGQGVFYDDGPLYMAFEVDDSANISRATFRANGLFLGEVSSAPFEVTVPYETFFVDPEDLPTNVFLQFEAVDRLGQSSIISANVSVHRREVWRIDTLGEIWSTAVQAPDGNLVFANKNNLVVALRPDGTEAWQASVDGAVDMGLAVDPVSGRIFAGTSAGTIYGINPGGGEAWSRNISSPPGGDLLFREGTVYVPGFTGDAYALNSATGDVRWTVPLGGQVLSRPSITSDGLWLVGAQDNRMHAIRDGSELWSAETGNEVWSGAVEGLGGSIFFGSNDGWVYAVDNLGGPRWETEVEGQIWSRLTSEPDGSAVYVASTSRSVHELDPLTGEQIWSTRLEGLSTSSPIIGPDGNLYVGTTAGNIYALETENGEVLWSYPLGNTIHASPLIVDDILYVGTTGRSFFSVRIGAPLTESPEE